MQTIFIIGNIGVGKSTFSKVLLGQLVKRDYAAVSIDLDQITSIVLKRPEVIEKITARFGVYETHSELAKVVFKDKDSLSVLNEIVHPYVYEVMLEQMHTFKEQGADIVIIEETAFSGKKDGFARLADNIVCVIAEDSLRQARCIEKGMTLQDFEQRTNLQLGQMLMMECADFIVNNNDDTQHLIAEAEKFIDLL